MVCFNMEAIMAVNTDTQRAHEKRLLAMESKLDDVLQQSDATRRVNNELLEAYHASREENTLLKAAVEELTRKITEQASPPTPASLEIANDPSAGEEMSLQLFDVQRDIRDVLEAVRNPTGKRKRAPSTNYHDVERTSSSTRRPTPRRPREASPVHSLMHSRHATTAAQEELDALANKSSPSSLTTMPTAAAQPTPTTAAEPTPKTSAEPDVPLPDAPAAAPVATEEWRIARGKAARRKAKAAEAKKKWTATLRDETPNKTNGGRGKKAHQPRNNTGNHRAAETWADVVRRGGINVQIVLGKGNLRTTKPETGKKERRDGARDGAAHRLGRKREGGGRGGMYHDDNGEGRRNKGQPGAATPVQTGHLGQKMRDGHKHGLNGVTGPTPYAMYLVTVHMP
jgi:hypothetical protein